VRCPPFIGRELAGDRRTDAEPGPELLDHMDDAEVEARLDLDRPFAPPRTDRSLASLGIEDPADAPHQALERRSVEAVGATEAVHHLGLDVTLLGMADVLGEGVVADDRAVLVAALRGSKVHAHAYSVS
jgi:hypothetical protein